MDLQKIKIGKLNWIRIIHSNPIFQQQKKKRRRQTWNENSRPWWLKIFLFFSATLPHYRYLIRAFDHILKHWHDGRVVLFFCFYFGGDVHYVHYILWCRCSSSSTLYLKKKKKKTFRFNVSAGITRPQGDGVSSL